MAPGAVADPGDAGRKPTFGMDWESDPSTLSEHARFIRSVDWESSVLGSPSQWPQQLLHLIDLVLIDPTPSAIMWGDDLTVSIIVSFFLSHQQNIQ